MGTQKEIAKKIIAGKAGYVLAVKGNQGFLEDDIQEAFKESKVDDEFEAKLELGHGRIESRTTRVIYDLDWICGSKEWKQLHCMIWSPAKGWTKKQAKKSWQYAITSAVKKQV